MTMLSDIHTRSVPVIIDDIISAGLVIINGANVGDIGTMLWQYETCVFCSLRDRTISTEEMN